MFSNPGEGWEWTHVVPLSKSHRAVVTQACAVLGSSSSRPRGPFERLLPSTNRGNSVAKESVSAGGQASRGGTQTLRESTCLVSLRPGPPLRPSKASGVLWPRPSSQPRPPRVLGAPTLCPKGCPGPRRRGGPAGFRTCSQPLPAQLPGS